MAPFAVTGITLTTATTGGYQVLQFTSASPFTKQFTSTATGTDSYANAPGAYGIRYQRRYWR